MYLRPVIARTLSLVWALAAQVYNFDPRINALVLRNWGTPSQLPGDSRHDTYQAARSGAPYFAGGSDRWVQINHSSVGNAFFDRNRDGVADGGFTGLEQMLDAAEVWSADILAGNTVDALLEPGPGLCDLLPRRDIDLGIVRGCVRRLVPQDGSDLVQSGSRAEHCGCGRVPNERLWCKL